MNLDVMPLTTQIAKNSFVRYYSDFHHHQSQSYRDFQPFHVSDDYIKPITFANQLKIYKYQCNI